MVDPNELRAVSRAADAELQLFKEVVRLEGVISGEHGIGLSKRPFMKLGLSSDELALMSRLKAAFDPNGILNPGKIFPDCSQDDSESSG
jgi:glycolate oxidase